MREYLIRVRQTGDMFTATVRQVAPGAILDAPAAPGTTDHTREAHTFAGAVVGAVLGSRILDVEPPAEYRAPVLPALPPTHGGYPTISPVQ